MPIVLRCIVLLSCRSIPYHPKIRMLLLHNWILKDLWSMAARPILVGVVRAVAFRRSWFVSNLYMFMYQVSCRHVGIVEGGASGLDSEMRLHLRRRWGDGQASPHTAMVPFRSWTRPQHQLDSSRIAGSSSSSKSSSLSGSDHTLSLSPTPRRPPPPPPRHRRTERFEAPLASS